jgi:hypothetical protein
MIIYGETDERREVGKLNCIQDPSRKKTVRSKAWWCMPVIAPT